MTNDSIDLLRIVDASINRVREGLRVAEDFVRFGLDDPFLSRLLKETRHELASIIQDLPQSRLLASRDTLGDVGTEIRTTSEYKRSSLSDVACASLKRVQEGLRSLE
ncbi:MAG: thiamine phosphate synthase, partial [Planctomycetes bacterium]|nr:thiamine phosphate synthase [Planctomycetota bacterium]